ncbi:MULTISPECIES: response regulator transcription factor [Bacillaceae]|uniref:Response regulator transcription factor n=1 Tax=Evansella alkalicola TaxID=745819 RepID=A0ABS6JWL7_9BACI|nr:MULTISPECIES: response regulator transcription factor [Bacillaceae]MBU9722959.1 response regulator transcription factor [Bacillus alkalicola]
MWRRNSINVLIVDDEPDMIKLISLILTKYRKDRITSAVNGLEAVDLVRYQEFDVVILDIMLPGIDGFEVCRRMRHFTNIPILMLSARCSEEDKVKGLEVGADDYLVKPFSAKELLARIDAIYRRVHQYDQKENGVVFKTGAIELDLIGRKVRHFGHEVKLTKKEFDLLQLFIQHKGHVFSRQQLLDHIWGVDFLNATTRTVDTHVKTLRLKLKQSGSCIQTVWGIGYKFECVSARGEDKYLGPEPEKLDL